MNARAFQSESPASSVKPWRVLHACEKTSEALAIVEAESSVGMNPQMLSREYWNGNARTEISLMTAWKDVRDWRHALNEAEAINSLQIVHAHSFASAMAGVRGSIPLVYDFRATLEDIASHGNSSGPWLLRSFRVAEQFALSRAAAVVTHSTEMKEIAAQRGAPIANVFVVPEPALTGITPEVVGKMYDDVYRHANSRRTDSIPRIPAPKLYALGTT
jgi:Glycosyl transferase 4-like domain